ncbi:protein gp37 [Sulfobacillus thermosulfidooxidans DSM 9293]|uniref:Protein gp37 n=1 Tax=Sulfobacillus thermosulfidooxidans (strain DSM 9293 / VKM B-1269 / AT-1) TaxID=929705 RepID=A0A1W1W6R2_SULTA|nr:phage Gp37/Gp68 family protein [Sulfobacillus thermosulfidooxidans]SMC01974.1 protein gp37 [Sulfobacillus thermosulfidooxidans DSM 9293]
MADHSRIDWTDATWNPVTGCSKVSPGCQHCYAERLSHRFGWTTQPWTAPHAAENVRWDRLRVMQPLHWRKPRRIFVNSMGDLFHDQVPDAFLIEVFTTIQSAPRHIFQVLTKRPARMRAWMLDPPRSLLRRDGQGWPPPNLWLGVSVEDQRWADERIPLLVTTPAAIRFVSGEPLLAPLDLTSWLPDLDWVIVGAESGPGARPMDDDWVRSLRDQCLTAGVAFWFKQRADAQGHKQLHPQLDGRTWHMWPRTASAGDLHPV